MIPDPGTMAWPVRHRVAKRVPLDFDAPLDEVWAGYRVPDDLLPDPCPTCTPHTRMVNRDFGDGLTREARAVDQTFYPHMIDGPHAEALAWHDKLGQDEVDHLVEQGRLVRWDPDAGAWDTGPRSAAEVNEANRLDTFTDLVHDAVNRTILCEFRCRVLGIERRCRTCNGRGRIYESPAHETAHQSWEPSEPPVGPGWQLWEQASDGRPLSPVFATPDELSEWCAENEAAYPNDDLTAEQWLASFTDTTKNPAQTVIVRGAT